jgi:hypothetical protein
VNFALQRIDAFRAALAASLLWMAVQESSTLQPQGGEVRN